MRNIIYTLFLFCLLFANVKAQDLMYPYGSEPVEITNLEWNRYTKDKFTILSVNDSQGKSVLQNVDKIRSWCLVRWGFPDVALSKELRIFCVPDKALMKKLFSLEQSRVEVRKDVIIIWLISNSDPLTTLPECMTQAVLSEFESNFKVKLGFWFKRGSSILNGVVPKVKQNLIDLNENFISDKAFFLSEKVFSITEEDYVRENIENRVLFDRQAVALCLMLRKEFGEAKLQGFLRVSNKNNFQQVMKIIYGFDNFSKFDEQYIKYMRELSSDVVNNKTPDSYLEIKPIR